MSKLEKALTPTNSVRLDRWLWAARFYKTRQLAIAGLRNNRVLLNGRSAKPAAALRAGDLLLINRGSYRTEVTVCALSEQRGPAKVAQTLYEETAASIAAREEQKQLMALAPRIEQPRTKPDKRAVRESRQIKRKP
ncbi:MAG: RNA-binding S4 domain-containing protein [Gammaproteobacteria bacterium]|nr:RNA-binding S4 domain-containing protein [Gammaproteobacteria bacterium]